MRTKPTKRINWFRIRHYLLGICLILIGLFCLIITMFTEENELFFGITTLLLGLLVIVFSNHPNVI